MADDHVKFVKARHTLKPQNTVLYSPKTSRTIMLSVYKQGSALVLTLL